MSTTTDEFSEPTIIDRAIQPERRVGAVTPDRNVAAVSQRNGTRASAHRRVPYRELDPNIVALVRVLNRFPGIHTIGSCGGHEDPAPYQVAAGEWWVLFEVDHTEPGWVSLEFLSWVINHEGGRAGSAVLLTPDSGTAVPERPRASAPVRTRTVGPE